MFIHLELVAAIVESERRPVGMDMKDTGNQDRLNV